MPTTGIGIGTMDQWVTLQQGVDVTDAILGQGPQTWSTVVRVPAEITSLSGSERIAAQAVSSQVAYSVRIRYRDDVVSAWRVLWRTKILQIASVLLLTQGRTEYLLLECAEVP